MTELYALIVPCKKYYPYNVHVTLNKREKTLRVVYFKGWNLQTDSVKNEVRYWYDMIPKLTMQQSKKELRKSKISLKTARRYGRAKVSPALFKDLFDIDLDTVVPCKVSAHTAITNNRINEFTMIFSYAAMGDDLLSQIRGLTIGKAGDSKIFSEDPDREVCIDGVAYFKPSYWV